MARLTSEQFMKCIGNTISYTDATILVPNASPLIEAAATSTFEYVSVTDVGGTRVYIKGKQVAEFSATCPNGIRISVKGSKQDTDLMESLVESLIPASHFLDLVIDGKRVDNPPILILEKDVSIIGGGLGFKWSKEGLTLAEVPGVVYPSAWNENEVVEIIRDILRRTETPLIRWNVLKNTPHLAPKEWGNKIEVDSISLSPHLEKLVLTTTRRKLRSRMYELGLLRHVWAIQLVKDPEKIRNKVTEYNFPLEVILLPSVIRRTLAGDACRDVEAAKGFIRINEKTKKTCTGVRITNWGHLVDALGLRASEVIAIPKNAKAPPCLDIERVAKKLVQTPEIAASLADLKKGIISDNKIAIGLYMANF